MAVLGIANFGASALFAAEADELFSDEFSELDPSLGEPSESLGVKDQALFFRLNAGYFRRTFYDALLFDNADATLRVRMPDFAAESENSIGLAFWGSSLDEYYVLQISDAGTYCVARAQPGSWNYPMPWRSTDAIKTEPGAWNELRVVTSGNRATVFINGKEMARIKGKCPEIGGRFGFYAEAGKQDLVAEYSNLKVVEGPEPDPNDVANDPRVILSDDFSTLDPAWGPERGWFTVDQGHLAIQFSAKESYDDLYRGATFEDADVSIKVRSVTEPADDGDYAGSGVIFWASGYDEYYSIQVTSDGWVEVSRLVGKEILRPYKAKELPAEAKFDAKGWTTIHFVTTGKRVAIDVNGVKIASLPGQPPKSPWKIGVSGQSGRADSVSQFSELTVRKP